MRSACQSVPGIIVVNPPSPDHRRRFSNERGTASPAEPAAPFPLPDTPTKLRFTSSPFSLLSSSTSSPSRSSTRRILESAAFIGVVLLICFVLVTLVGLGMRETNEVTVISTEALPPEIAELDMAVRRDTVAATLAIEAAIDIDGDIKVWQRNVPVQLLPTERERSAGFWREAAKKTCSGDLIALRQRSGNGAVVHGRLGGCAGITPPIVDAPLHAETTMKQGTVGWIVGSAGEFALALSDAQAPEGGFVALGEVDPNTLAELDDLRAMPLDDDVFAPPIRFTVK